MPQPTLTFLDLPPEIRLNIYKLLIISPLPYVPLNNPAVDHLLPSSSDPPTPCWHPTFPHNLLLVSSQIYHEVRPLYFAHNAFSVFLSRKNETLNYFLASSFLDYRREIRSLCLVIARWGRNDFFVRRLYPVLADMILNGSLRDLQIQVKRRKRLVGELERMKRLGVRRFEGSMKSGEAVSALSNLCEDPYLERVVIKELQDEVYCGHFVLEEHSDEG